MLRHIKRFLNGKKRIWLALGGGGSGGLAHIGVIKTLLDNNISIDYIGGTSAGALVGGLYAAFNDISKVEAIAREVNYKQFFIAFSDPFPGGGLFKGNKISTFLKNHLGDYKIEDLSVPFCAVATDINSGKAIALDKGDLVTAIRASSSLPVLLQPVKIENRYLIDGGVSQPVPVNTVRAMGADIVIAVDLYALPKKSKEEAKKEPSALTIAGTSLTLLLYHLAQENIKDADVVIDLPLANLNLIEFVHGENIIEKGEKAADTAIPEIKRLLRKQLSFKRT